jgi:flagellum-specific peptidoglycan hydrolase FlgJ
MTRDAFVKVISELVVKENKKRGNPLFNSVVIAQAICESGWRTKSNNDESKCSIWNKSWRKLERKSLQ